MSTVVIISPKIRKTTRHMMAQQVFLSPCSQATAVNLTLLTPQKELTLCTAAMLAKK